MPSSPADIDVFDIELDTKNVDEFVRTVKILEPTFGGVNLEDIKAPESFEIERRLVEELNIPVMHDDQHGTAIISSAALLNAVEISKKKMSEVSELSRKVRSKACVPAAALASAAVATCGWSTLSKSPKEYSTDVRLFSTWNCRMRLR